MLSDRRIRALKPAPRDKWYCDGNGLYLRVRATGGRSWVLRRKRGGHVEVITVGAWPALGLAQARLKAGALAGKDVSTLTLGALLDTWHSAVVRKTYRRPRCASPSTPAISRSPPSIGCPTSSWGARKPRGIGC